MRLDIWRRVLIEACTLTVKEDKGTCLAEEVDENPGRPLTEATSSAAYVTRNVIPEATITITTTTTTFIVWWRSFPERMPSGYIHSRRCCSNS